MAEKIESGDRLVKYLHRLETTSNTLLKEAYSLSKELHNRGIQTWYSTAIYILKLLNVNITSFGT